MRDRPSRVSPSLLTRSTMGSVNGTTRGWNAVGGRRHSAHGAGPGANQPPSERARTTPFVCILAFAFGSCDPGNAPPAPAMNTLEASPNASIIPSPLLTGSSLVSKLPKSGAPAKNTKGVADAVVMPLPLHQPLSPDEEPSKLQAPITLNAKFSWPAFPAALRLWGVDAEQQATFVTISQRLLEFTLRPHGRMQVAFAGRAFAFDDRSLLQARYENTGHVLVWPERTRYRIIPVGSLRSLFNEGRPDATPLVNLEPESHPAGTMLGYATRVWSFETPQGKLTLHQAEAPEAELAAALVCRFLVELMSIAPATSTCGEGRLPLRAEFETTKGGRALFEVLKVEATPEGSVSNVLVPPKDSRSQNFGVPPGRDLVSAMALGVLRRGDKDGTLTVHNPTGQLRYVLLDGVPIGRVAPLASTEITGISQGQYLARLVDFWGSDSLQRSALALGDAVTIGEPLRVPTEPEL
jgi:hypothetical protein